MLLYYYYIILYYYYYYYYYYYNYYILNQQYSYYFYFHLSYYHIIIIYIENFFKYIPIILIILDASVGLHYCYHRIQLSLFILINHQIEIFQHQCPPNRRFNHYICEHFQFFNVSSHPPLSILQVKLLYIIFYFNKFNRETIIITNH